MDRTKNTKNNIILNPTSEYKLQDSGYFLAGNVGKKLLQKLKKIYKVQHAFPDKPSGIYNALYNQDITYRTNLHTTLQELLKPVYDALFVSYKSIGNYVITKFPGPNSVFDIHQDTTILDETAYTPLNVWIPLQDTDIDNGCLCLVSKSHQFAHPYRGASFAGQFAELATEIMPYLLPIPMKAGDILVFDNRMLHYSAPNTSKKARVTIMSGIQHQDAAILTCFQKNENEPIELNQQPDNYLYTYTGFGKSPERSGVKIAELNSRIKALDQKEFMALVAAYDLQRIDAFSAEFRGNYRLKNNFFTRLLR
jgi:hypothetical protein